MTTTDYLQKIDKLENQLKEAKEDLKKANGTIKRLEDEVKLKDAVRYAYAVTFCLSVHVLPTRLAYTLTFWL